MGALVLGALLAFPGDRVSGQVAPVDYGVRAGDKVTVTLYTGSGEEVRQAGGERIVDRGGAIFLPFIGLTMVSGLDQEEIRQLLQERYSEYYAGHVVQVSVELSVSVTGAVGRPGQFFVSPTTTVVGAIAQAGGMLPELTAPGLNNLPADQARVRLVRDGRTTILNLRPDEVRPEILQMPVQSGDWIHVPNQARSRVRDELQFWGGILSFVTNLVAIIVLVSR